MTVRQYDLKAGAGEYRINLDGFLGFEMDSVQVVDPVTGRPDTNFIVRQTVGRVSVMRQVEHGATLTWMAIFQLNYVIITPIDGGSDCTLEITFHDTPTVSFV